MVFKKICLGCTKAAFEQQGIDKVKFAPIAEKNWKKCEPYWWQFEEAGTYKGFIQLSKTDEAQLTFTAPKVDKPCTIHLILEVTDKAIPRLTSFNRVIITVVPK